MKQDLITVVVPVYNVSKYLKKCVLSILNQTYSNMEIFLVDDGSLDDSGFICDEFAKMDQRIQVIHKENGGLSDARNVAIDQATGKYITFVDSDDSIELDMIEFLYQNLIQHKATISTCLYQKVYDDTEISKLEMSSDFIRVFPAEKALEMMLYQKKCTTSAWGKLYSIHLFQNIRYPYGKICEDLDTTYLLFSNAQDIVISDSKKYYYLQRQNSIINSKFNKKRMDALYFAKEETEYIRKYHSNIIKSAINREFMEAIFILCQFPIEDKSFQSLLNKIIKTIKTYRKVVLFDSGSKGIYRFYAFLTYFGCKNFYRFFKLILKLKGV